MADTTTAVPPVGPVVVESSGGVSGSGGGDETIIPKHSVHTLVFRSLKRTHDMFLSDFSHPIAQDDEAIRLRKETRRKDEYAEILKMPKEVLPAVTKQQQQQQQQLHKQDDDDNDAEINNEEEASTNNKKIIIAERQRLAKEREKEAAAIREQEDNKVELKTMNRAFPASEHQQQQQQSQGNLAIGSSSSSSSSSSSVGAGSGAVALFSNQQFAVQQHKNRTLMSMPKPQWHAPWKLYRVISGHLGWVRCIDVDPSNEWFVTGAGDRIIKIWDLASGNLKLSLTGHVSSVRGVAVSARHPYLFSCGEDKQVKCWDLETNKVIRHYHGHLASCYGLSLHPALDILVSCGRDSTARMWDMRTKAQIHLLNAHTDTVTSVKCQDVDPQIITSSHDSTVRCWDIIAGKTMCTLTNHKKSVRALTLHPKYYSMASASPDNIKQWKFPKCEFIQNLSGHEAIVNALASNADNVMVSGADNGTLYMWDWLTGYNFQRQVSHAQSGSIDSEQGIFAMTFDQSGSRLLTCEADKTIKIYKEDENATEETHPVQWKPDLLKRKRF